MANALLLLNMVVSITLTTSVTDYPCILPFFKLVPENPEKYLVSMQSFDPGPCYVQVKHIQMMVFAVNHSSTLECPIRRFHQPFDIIVTYLNNQTFNTFITFFKFSMHPSTLFIFIVKQGESETQSLSHFRDVQLQLPAMKLLMAIKPDKSVALRKLCCEYCKDESLKNTNLSNINIVAMHKTTFWNGNGKEIKAVIYNHRSDYFKNYANDLYACSRMVSRSEYCASGIMSAIYISHLHNISLKILNAVDSNQLSKDLLRNSLFIVHKTKQFFILTIRVGPLHFHYQLVCFQTFTVIIGKVPNVNGTLFVKKRFVIIVSIFGMAICQFYGNVITSCTTISFHSKPFENLKELLDNGYKLLWYSYFYPHPNRTLEKAEFERAGELNRLNNSYYEVRGNHSSIDTHSFYLKNKNNKKFAILQDSATVNTLQAAIQKTINSGLDADLESRCHIIQQKLCSSVNFWELYSMNRYWLMKTLLRLQDSGLMKKWDDWFTLVLRLKGRCWVSPERYRSEFIELPQIMSVLILLTSLCGISFGVFVFECT
ncbi:unnamed protein product [Orchesella dallaii]|uniref:Uncharacterized protein n=1 Tax=Orchesella dallaii TaxID=48710 RepID=A0ABP1S580_9HEXA